MVAIGNQNFGSHYKGFVQVSVYKCTPDHNKDVATFNSDHKLNREVS